MGLKIFLVNKSDKIRNIKLERCEICSIDINSWFKNNNLTASNMNEVRQYIFEEWLHKKIAGSKTKILLGTPLVIIYDNPTVSFIDLIEEKILDVLDFIQLDIEVVE